MRLAERNRLIDGGASPLAQTLKTPSSPINLAQHSLKCAPRLAAWKQEIIFLNQFEGFEQEEV